MNPDSQGLNIHKSKKNNAITWIGSYSTVSHVEPEGLVGTLIISDGIFLDSDVSRDWKASSYLRQDLRVDMVGYGYSYLHISLIHFLSCTSPSRHPTQAMRLFTL
jgi:hypothetical protein